MTKLQAAVVVCVFGFSGVAFSGAVMAQNATPDARGACSDDYKKFCAGTAPGGGRIVACLNKQHDHLSDSCKKAIDSRKPQ
ncbi:cysteine rich repeat-containing protein [Bradyrhizobium sp. dw_78]|uniref:cysteine rich repeat-containing protein n=1 Tax=Bradyrhizobium sp. dw_78 TaxID=2719793 RepID=UPI001BD395E1|nr:cysteine rich repeat-containing protein [Bradyrhizobium sp. dw_78]